jgi:hypothetical protein
MQGKRGQDLQGSNTQERFSDLVEGIVLPAGFTDPLGIHPTHVSHADDSHRHRLHGVERAKWQMCVYRGRAKVNGNIINHR